MSTCRDLKNVSKIAHLSPVDANIIVLPICIFGMYIVLYAPHQESYKGSNLSEVSDLF